MIDLSPYIGLTTMLILATKDASGNPYTSNMYFRVDDDYNFYFKSKISREHSQHIDKDPNIAWSIINTEKYVASSKDKKGLQFQGTSLMLTGKEAEKVQRELYKKDMNFMEILQSSHMIYKCTPTRVKIWDETLYGGEGKVIDF